MQIEFQRPRMYAKQFAAIYDPHRISVIEASTKSGKTAGCIIWIIEQALKGQAGWAYWWVAPVSDQSLIAFNRVRNHLPHDVRSVNISLRTITLINGAVIFFKSADKPDSLYGEDVHACVIDEASRMKELAWFAVQTTLTYTGGPIRIIGNVRGKKNWAYRIARDAENKVSSDLAYHKIVAQDAVDAGVLVEENIEVAREHMPEAIWRELYLAEAADDGGNPFGEDHIRASIIPALSKGNPASWGWDLAKKVDHTVGIALDQAGYVCRFERMQKVPWPDQIKRIWAVTGSVRALVDSTGLGDPVLDHLQTRAGSRFEGYNFSQASKQKLMEGLAVAIQSHSVGFPDGQIVRELLNFGYETTRTGVLYMAPEGYPDDCVMALALAVMCRQMVPQAPVFTNEMVAQLRGRRPSYNYRQIRL